jgi:1,4-alpha-glucan branching enzyme
LFARVAADLQVALSSDEAVFGGWQNVTKNSNVEFQTVGGDYDNRPNSIQVRVHPSRIPAG